ncbi:MAG: hypothetical protein RLZZ308_150 [Candidatus Parcubacteria bacterium]|jgi:putative flippase GtrA
MKTLFNNLFITKSLNKYIELFRYIIMGGIAFVADFTTLLILTEWFHVHYLVSNIFSFIVGLSTNYTIGTLWVFRERKITNRKQEFITVASISVGGLLLTQFFMWFLTEIGGVLYFISKIIASILVLFYNFFIRKKVIYSSKNKVSF